MGVAPNANIINLRVLDANGAGSDSQVIAAIQRAIQLKNTYNIRVINLSLGRNIFESYTLDPVCQAVEAAWQSGIVVVVAAGNAGRNNDFGTQGYATILAPANDPNVITVGATKTNGSPGRLDDTVASYSSKGPTLLDHIVKPDLVAPGNRIVSLSSPGSKLVTSLSSLNIQPTSSCSGSSCPNGKYTRLSGTSMATRSSPAQQRSCCKKTPRSRRIPSRRA
jgi:serine protease AprX